MEKRTAIEWKQYDKTCDCASLIDSVISELSLKGLLPKSYEYKPSSLGYIKLERTGFTITYVK